MIAPELNDCFLHDKDRIAHAEAVKLLVERTRTHGRTENIPVSSASGRYIVDEMTAPSPVPGHRNAAVDGYAFATTDYDASDGTTFDVVARVAAGHPLHQTPPHGSCVRIFTGAPVPDAFDTVVMQEDVTLTPDGKTMMAPSGLKAGINIRAAGEDLEMGASIATPGQKLRPQDLAALTSAGYETISCYETPVVGLFSSGDEVVRPGRPLEHGQVYDANAAMLPALIEATGATFQDLGILPDDRTTVRQKLLEAAETFDLVITSGGASLGEEDHIVSVLDEIGKRHLWQIAVKPGRPMMFGQLGQAVFMGLPGNPVAVFVCFLLYGRPLLTRLGGGTWVEPTRFKVMADFSIPKKKTDRREFLRGALVSGPHGPVVRKFPKDGSGLITSLREANGFIELAEDVSSVSEGDLVDFLPFSALGIA